ncbi:hypothetical protein PGIN_3A1_01245 [Porphyromonas gingivalis]|nr:hypothetical protein PGIN_3A1_01245 [Porphyromonas gingivalis]
MPFSGTRPKDTYPFCLFGVHIQGSSLCTAHSINIIIYLISGKYNEKKTIIPLFGVIFFVLMLCRKFPAISEEGYFSFGYSQLSSQKLPIF